MQCDLNDSRVVVKLIVGITLDGSGIIFTLISLLFLLINNEIDKSLRSILISFQVGNLLGNLMHIPCMVF